MNTLYRLGDEPGYRTIQQFAEPIGIPGPYEILVRIKAIALNYRDIAIASRTYPFDIKKNVIPCSDAAGIVAGIGPKVDEFEVGDRVVGNFNLRNIYGPQQGFKFGQGGQIDGVLQRYIVLHSQSVLKISPQIYLSWEQLACLVCTGVTAWNILYGNVPLKPGQTVLLQGKLLFLNMRLI
jgi:NADPH:quinone reductase-like Zn-dependent oxidoreductase